MDVVLRSLLDRIRSVERSVTASSDRPTDAGDDVVARSTPMLRHLMWRKRLEAGSRRETPSAVQRARLISNRRPLYCDLNRQDLAARTGAHVMLIVPMPDRWTASRWFGEV
jgi:hypothetical protein